MLSLLFYLGIKLIPDSVTYTVSTSEKKVSSENTSIVSTNRCLYDNVFLIEHSGPFRITAEGGDIFVYSDKERLYRIKAHLDEFPSSDRDSIVSGISVSDKALLYEIVQYMES